MEEAQSYNQTSNFPVNPPHKSNKKFIIPIIILSAAVIALSGYIAIPLLQEDARNNSPNENSTSENSNEDPNPEEDDEGITSENPTENTIPTTWTLSEASALTESDAAQIKSLYSDNNNVSFDTNEIVGQKNIHNSPIYPYQFMSVDSLPHHTKENTAGFGAAVYAYRTSPTSAWQEGFSTQSTLDCQQFSAVRLNNNKDALKAFATFECHTPYESTTTIGTYNNYRYIQQFLEI